MFRVLFVDDDPSMRLLMKRVLSTQFEVEAAAGGQEALQLLQEAPSPFAVVVADLSMAQGDGMQLLNNVKECAPQTTRILMSGDHRLSTDPDLAERNDLFRLLFKPVNNSAVLDAVKAGVARHQELSAA